MLQKLAFLLVSLGGLVLIGWAVKNLFTSNDVSLLVRITVGAVAAGILILLGVAVMDRLAKRKREDFEGWTIDSGHRIRS